MISRKTVFVVGAGASNELNFPLSDTLLERISSDLNFYFRHGERPRGEMKIWEELRRYAALTGLSDRDVHHAAWRVRDAAHIGISIDNVVHQLGEDPAAVYAAKLGIAHSILLAESKCALRRNRNTGKVAWENVRGTWLALFAQLLVQGMQRGSIENIFENVSVVSFNYDRTIRQFLPFALMSQFAISDQEAHALSRTLPIFHPYGSLGHLSTEAGQPAVQFGETEFTSLSTVAGNVRTFTEQTDDDADLAEMRLALSSAEQIVFLGFGYISQNMELLTKGVDGHAHTILGTSLGLSPSDQEIVVNQLNGLIASDRGPSSKARLSDLKCTPFLRENFRTISA